MLKTSDGAIEEVNMVKEAGANAVTVLGSAPTETLNLFIEDMQEIRSLFYD